MRMKSNCFWICIFARTLHSSFRCYTTADGIKTSNWHNFSSVNCVESGIVEWLKNICVKTCDTEFNSGEMPVGLWIFCINFSCMGSKILQLKSNKTKMFFSLFCSYPSLLIYWPDSCDQALDGVRHSARMTGQNRPRWRIFGVYDQRACCLQQVGGTVEHGAGGLEDGFLRCSALKTDEDIDKTGIWTVSTCSRLAWLYLTADLSRDTGKLWVGGKYSQIFNSFN